LLQRELLKALMHHAPQTYALAVRKCGLTIEKAQTLVERGEVVGAARAMKLAQLIAQEPQWGEIFTEAGTSLFETLYQELPLSLKLMAHSLPRPWRIRLALAVTRRIAHNFAGGSGRLVARRQRGRLYLAVVDGLFSDRLETLAGAHAFYRAVLETMFQRFARANCQAVEVKPTRLRLDQCCFEIAWEA
jgi:hypothetical protein